MHCAACSHENPHGVEFCTHCHATLIFRCGRCWHQQTTHAICEKCGADMDNFWRTQLATAQAIHIKEEADHRERLEQLRDGMQSHQLPPPEVLPLAASVLLPAPFALISSVLFGWLISRWRRWSE